jgi:hypothetical protein
MYVIEANKPVMSEQVSNDKQASLLNLLDIMNHGDRSRRYREDRTSTM